MIKKTILTLLVLGVVGGLTYWLSVYFLERKRLENLDTTPTTESKLVTINEVVSSSGIVEPLDSTEVRSEINGKISEILVKNGDLVKREQILMELDRITWQSDETRASNEYQIQKFNLEKATRDFNRQKELKSKGYAIEKDYQDAETDFQKSQIQLAVAKAAWDKSLDNLSKTTIRAPQDGIITDLTVNPGQVIVGAGSVSQGTLLMKVSDLDKLYVEVKINEVEIAKVKPDSIPKVTFDSMRETHFTGHISEISPYAVNQTNVRVFPVKVIFDADGKNIRPGISANVEFPVSTATNVCGLTLSTVFTEKNKSYVYVRHGDLDNVTWEKRKVEIGIRNMEFVEIKSGVKVGEVVALTKPKSLKEDSSKPRAQAQGRGSSIRFN